MKLATLLLIGAVRATVIAPVGKQVPGGFSAWTDIKTTDAIYKTFTATNIVTAINAK